MKFGVREICDVVFRAKNTMTVGKKKFYKHEPVIYFDSLKTSTLEGAVTTVYAQGGKGNARLMAWDGEKTVTFTMEDALISPLGMQILTGAGLIEAAGDRSIIPVTETVKLTEANAAGTVTINTQKKINTSKVVKIIIPNGNYNNLVYSAIPADTKQTAIAVSGTNKVITITDSALAAGEIAASTEATVIYYDADAAGVDTTKTIKVHTTCQARPTSVSGTEVRVLVKGYPYSTLDEKEHFIYVMALNESGDIVTEPYCVGVYADSSSSVTKEDGSVWYTVVIPLAGGKNDLSKFSTEKPVLVDYYVEKSSGVTQIDITPTSLGGNFYVEASTLFRNQAGVDMPAEFIIPNAKVQSNFTFTMASTGDPSTFTFTMDAFPDYTRFNPEEKVFASIQIVEEDDTNSNAGERQSTHHSDN